jgi:indole-3-glycerol phosphate synthase
LNLILEAKKKRVAVLRKNRDAFLSLIKKAPAPRPFKEAIKREGKISLIGEIKQASPSAGILRKDFSVVDIAKQYKKLKVNALSILTEEDFFLGKINYIEQVKKAVNLPILRKDFIIDEVQLLESRAIGANAVLLIARILDEHKLKQLYSLCKKLGMEALVEVHTEKELRRVAKFHPDMIGINNRNLDTLELNISKTEKLIPFVPSETVKISESGIKSTKDVLLLKGLGVDAILVGEALMKAENLVQTMKELHIDA